IKQNPSGFRSVDEFCQQIPVSIENLFHVAFHIRNLKRHTIDQLLDNEEKMLLANRNRPGGVQITETFIPDNTDNHQTNNDSHNEYTNVVDNAFNLTRIPKESILEHKHFLILWNWLPPRLSLSQPELLFTTQEHGCRLQTLLDKIDDIEYSIMIVKASNGEIFGAFCAGLWSLRHNKTYFGCGESFLFTLHPKPIKYPWIGIKQLSDDAHHRHLITNEKNSTSHISSTKELFLFVSNEKISIGGGGNDGLSIDQSLCDGRTSRCETFQNEPLCSLTYFTISILMLLYQTLISCQLIFIVYSLKPIHLTLVVCGDRVTEASNALKSALIFTPPPLIFHIFTENHLKQEFQSKVLITNE
ncbi:unnamed protein product, partial [Didymodactylos carnosus]